MTSLKLKLTFPLAAFGLIAAGALVANGGHNEPAHSADMGARYQLTLQSYGDRYVADYNLTGDDCAAALAARNGRGWSCQEQR